MNYDACRQIFSKFYDKTLLIGFSGGADSTALLEIVRELQPDFSYRFTAIHFNHHLRGAESDREAQNAGKFALTRGIGFQKVDLEVSAQGNLENAAREARLEAWKTLVKEYRADAVLLAHHADDRLENLLLRLGRGANASGATSLRAVSYVNGICFVRPLLDFTKEELVGFLRQRGVTEFAEDSSNADCRYFRNSLRHKLLPALYAASPGGKSGFLAALEALEKDALFLENAAKNYFDGGDPGDAVFWRQAPEALRPRLLRRFIFEKTKSDFLLTSGDCRRLDEALSCYETQTRRLTLSGGITLILTRDSLSLELPEPPEVLWDWQSKTCLRWGNFQLAVIPDDGTPCAPDEARFAQDTLPCPLIVNTAKEGETMIPFGRDSREKLKKLRTDRKQSAYPPLPVLRDENGNILWFAGVRQGREHAVTFPHQKSVRFKLRALPLFQHENRADGE
ncbi:MAG: tRNA lysidine(34) synthetase TilS [Victivallaceae bacterium]|nr:tRNA lysidine(34) synthetase TilS [Victivallaceae bacterium]